MKLESIVSYLDVYLSVARHPDYAPAHNGLQVEGTRDVRRVASAVDASLATIEEAVERGADLLVAHHGLFWSGSAPITGRYFRRVRALIDGGLALYGAHLPLDAHPEVGNCALLCRAMGIDPVDPFGSYEGVTVGWAGPVEEPGSVEELAERLGAAVGGGPVHLIAGGPAQVDRVAVVTGGGAAFAQEAADLGLDALVTGEGPHHAYMDAMELGIHVLFGGHYATETFGVRALCRHLADRFDIEDFFIDQPTGL